MAQSINRSVSAQESNIQEMSKEDDCHLESRYECPICYYWLNEPVLTSCGHRFCRKCITSWLKKETVCPVDKQSLSMESDIFPDNFTRREILQIKKPCPNATFGCLTNVSPVEMDAHVLICEFRRRTTNFSCYFARCGCKFTAPTHDALDAHVKSEMAHHLELLMEAFLHNNTLESESRLWDAPMKANGGPPAASDLVRSMYERIVVLEQKQQEMSAKVEKMREQLSKTCSQAEIQAKYTDGVLVWQIGQFHSKIKAMSANPNIMFYSGEAYTSPHGYKFCARVNISPKVKDFIGLHVHMMQSENDYHLDWPFKGRIRISMIHPKNFSESQMDTIMSKPEILAFHRPTQEGVSPRGFGFLEYASITDIERRGFIFRDTLTIKIQINIV
ncbi:TNF receptor-associated factor 6-B [Phlebotomus argentipes]|uniref:TNF receptor-associated factor 6-B n=1 Tax=Phlebotomus argentipes TaxID=94469 RepID=UPI0028935A06|nr:TNF receptor-associated factor 6-B [Phlebotomus argentipes]